jgi:exonuclease SbcC
MSMKNDPSLNALHKAYKKKVDSLLENEGFRDLDTQVRMGVDNFMFQKSREESKMYDEAWVKALEAGFPYIEKIVKNPRNFIKEEGEVVLAALAKRVTPKSISHLASHTQFIRKINDDGSIQPEKILAINTEEDFQIYENRFVATLILKLHEFIERRYIYIQEHLVTTDSELLVIHAVNEIDGLTYEVDSRVKMSKPSESKEESDKNKEILDRIVKLRNQVSYFRTSIFMKSMYGFRPVRNPISQTNMIRKNPDYHNCYRLWCFLDKYDQMGVSYSVDETNKEFDEAYSNELYGLVLGSMLVLETNLIKEEKASPRFAKHKKILPKIKLSLEDETFLDKKFAYHEFPIAEQKARSMKEQPPSSQEVANQIVKDFNADFDEEQRIERIKDHEAEIAKAQELQEAAKRAQDRKEMQNKLAQVELALAYKAKKMLEEEQRQKALEAKKAEEAALLSEKKLLARQRKIVKEEALKAKRLEAQKVKEAAQAAAVIIPANPAPIVAEPAPIAVEPTPKAAVEPTPAVVPAPLPKAEPVSAPSPKANKAPAPLFVAIKTEKPVAKPRPKRDVKYVPHTYKTKGEKI